MKIKQYKGAVVQKDAGLDTGSQHASWGRGSSGPPSQSPQCLVTPFL